MPIIKEPTTLDDLIKHQKDDLRAYDQKASAYIASNSGLFVIALFTLCIFNMFHVGNNDIPQYGVKWWILLTLTASYVVLFCLSNIHSLFVLFPRVGKEDFIDTSYMDKSVTNFATTNASNMNEHLEAINNEYNEIKENHIKYNVFILRKKHFHSKRILPYSIAMSVVLLISIILLFVF